MTNMERLYQSLHQLKEIHRDLIRLAAEKKEAVMNNDVEALQRITHEEQQAIKALEAADSERIYTVESLLAEKGIVLPDATLMDLIKSTPNPEEKQRLQQEREELLGIVSELRDANQLNQQLLEQSLSFVRMSLDLLTDTPENDYIYKRPAGPLPQSPASRSFFNHKA